MGRDDQAINVAREPWPHLVSGALADPKLVETAAQEFPLPDSKVWENSSHHDCVGKKRSCTKIARMPPKLQDLIQRLNVDPFVTNLGRMFGIPHLLPDPWLQLRGDLYGAGLHQIGTGGFLGIHTDYTIHPTGLARRLNLLLYLNLEWKEEWGGKLELWDVAKDRKSANNFLNVLPLVNTAVIFATSDDSFHGHPDPITAPEGVTRNSLALYYYTATPVTNPRNTHYIFGKRE